jgi:hypothetical protein
MDRFQRGNGNGATGATAIAMGHWGRSNCNSNEGTAIDRGNGAHNRSTSKRSNGDGGDRLIAIAMAMGQKDWGNSNCNCNGTWAQEQGQQ